MNDLDLQPYSLILVAVLPQPRDMEIARLLGWYRIPIRSAPKVIDVDYLAFYQPGSFPPPEGGRINYLAQVKGHELTTRRELFRDACPPDRMNEEYYKIIIGPLLRLSNPISANHWKRITFFYTTGEYFNNAKSLRDLVVNSEDRSLLWKSLRERQELDGSGGLFDDQNDEMDPDVVQWLGLYFLSKYSDNSGGQDGALD